ncbi:efflux transporter outer membrane subunit [Solimicrobium silvestre]|uniref:Efflux transporter, outer membrane factor (OMF) lipoprotein, NodT family n=1 Tax=Solimicrobium silvestre TaxID=2099400 RepID=A0A2S9H153_9BURK|nr:efflux transporter outer membrane subunit [Solimicrobium silvestre]PRC93711.1 Efflux transporter, outer membrane factor (OMF) lipoprotein, NodT family [Solimicrobium silvestre]
MKNQSNSLFRPFFRPSPISLAIACIALVSGCAVGPDYMRPNTALPTQHTEQALDVAAAPEGEVTQKFVAGQDIPAQWWELFHSASLNELIQDSLKNSPNIQAAQAALRAAQENVAAQQGAYFPTLSAQFTPTRQHVASALASPASSNASIYNLHTAQLSISYVPDVFGLNRRQVESLQAQADMQSYQLQAAYLTLTSNLANAAITEASLRAQLAALNDVLTAQQKILEMVQRQFKLGQLGELDMAAQESAVANAQAAIAPVQKQLAQQRDLIKALAGRFPNDSTAAQFELASLQLPGEIPLTLPSTLVDHRPDILAAEAQLQSASAAVGVAIANRLPNITLGVDSYGSAAYTLANLFKSSTTFWNLAGSVVQPIFDGGTLKHKQGAAQAAYEQAEAQYRSTVISAFQNVADALQAIQADALALHAAKNAEMAANKTLVIAQKQLALGDISPSSMLTIEQNYQQAKLALVQTQAMRYADTVALFQALGGGWWNAKA